MPKTAFRIFSPTHGFLNESIEAIKIKGREDARKIGPFISSKKEFVFWVNWGTKKDGKKIRPYFRRYSDSNSTLCKIGEMIERENELQSAYKESEIHKKIKEYLLKAIKNMIDNGQKIEWFFNDERASDFPLSGNLLSEVIDVKKKHRIYPPFANYYSLDIALLGQTIRRKQILLGAIEIEYTHEVDLLKTLLCKSLGFPLVTIDASDARLDEINEEWCIRRLTETRVNAIDQRRRNYVYIHNMLYPVYLSNFESWRVDEKHQYIIFLGNDQVKKLLEYLKFLKESLNLDDNCVRIMETNINENDIGSVRLFENEGSLAGENWKNYNSKKFIRLILRRPEKHGNLYKFHLVLTQLLTLHFDCLVGYKHGLGKTNDNKDVPLWFVSRQEKDPENPEKFIWPKRRFCFKRVSEPVKEIIKYLPSMPIQND